MADKRFAALSTDPRYRLPNRKESRTAVDSRFKRLFTDQDFRQKASVDRYGRKIKPESGKKELEKLYRLEKPEPKRNGHKKVEREVVGSSDEESDEADEEEILVEKRDPARDGGFSESSSEEEESTSEEESDDEAELAEETAGQEQTESVPMGEVSRRLAAVNLDWDNIRAMDIMAVASSFAPKGGGVESVAIYPSEFGKERMQKEELEGPPREIFASSKRKEKDLSEEDEDEEEEDSDDDEKIKRQLQREQVGEGEEFDTAKLRQYQLERLRYYYAVITCDSEATGKALYDSMDSREYLTSSNFFDLRFIPDETSFDDDQPRDECAQLPTGYKPNDFRTEALTHSKVRLTWDDDDTTRKEVQKRAFSRAEIDENDLQAYIGSDSSDAESVSSRKSAAEERKLSKKAAAKAKMRAAFGLADEAAAPMRKGDKEEVVGDMQVTFTSGLGAGSNETGKGVFENEPQDEESTRMRYIRKEKERKQKRKERSKARKGNADEGEDEAVSDAGEMQPIDQGFDDPFFNDPKAAAAAEKKARKDEKAKKRAAQDERDAEAAAQKAELELLMAEDEKDNVRHFDMREIEKAQKGKNKKNKNKKKRDQDADADVAAKDTFEIETQDPRFKALFDSHEYAIDPSDPRFKGTEGMKALLEEGRRKRKFVDEDGQREVSKQSNKAAPDNASDLQSLVSRLGGGKKAKR